MVRITNRSNHRVIEDRHAFFKTAWCFLRLLRAFSSSHSNSGVSMFTDFPIYTACESLCPKLLKRADFDVRSFLSISQFLDVFLFASPTIASKQFLPELVVVTAGFDGQRHRDAPAKQEYFLFRLEPCQHAAQGIAARKTGEHGMDIVLVPEPAGDARPQLLEDLIIDLRGALVHDQEGDVVFA